MSDQSQAFKAIAKRISDSMAPLSERDPNLQTPKPAEKSSASKKRKSADKEPPNLDDIILPDDAQIPGNANQLRAKIRTYLASGEMTVSQFQNAIDVSGTSYYHFMNESGTTRGIFSDTFMGAGVFFMKRKTAGIGMPRKKKAKTETATARDKDKSKDTSKVSKEDLDVSSIHLDGEENDSVPVYDTPTEIRSKISAHLRTTSASQASLIRALKAQFNLKPPQGISPTGLNTYLSGSGFAHGNSSPITYAGYVYFEKLRIKEEKAKSKKREEMEKVWGKRGLDRESDSNGRRWMVVGDILAVSCYGEIKVCRQGKPVKERKGGVERNWSYLC